MPMTRQVKIKSQDKGYPDLDRFSIIISFFEVDRLAMLQGLIQHYKRSAA